MSSAAVINVESIDKFLGRGPWIGMGKKLQLYFHEPLTEI